MATALVPSKAAATAKSTLRLFDLPPEILCLLFRRYFSLDEKLHRLLDVLEFRPYLEDRAAYLSLPAPFSKEYLFCMLRSIRPGRYADRANWSHRLLLRIDPRTLNVHIDHYFLEGLDRIGSRMKYDSDFFRAPIDQMKRNIDEFLQDFLYLDQTPLLTYHLKNYGFIIVGRSMSLPRCSDAYRLRFFDWTQAEIRVGERCQLLEKSLLHSHFTVMLTSDRKLLVECTFPPQFRVCICESRVRELSPICFRVAEDYESLNWETEEKENAVIQRVGFQKFSLGSGGYYVDSTMTYNVKMLCPFLQVLEEERLRRCRLLLLNDQGF